MFGLSPWRTGPVLRKESSPFELMGRNVSSFFNRLFEELPLVMPEKNWEKFWGVTMEEAEKEVVVRFELPGFEAGEMDVHLAGNELKVEAVHKVVEEKKEVESMKVHRAVTLPPNLDLEQLAATYRNGILEVRVPKLPEAQGRKIEVKT